MSQMVESGIVSFIVHKIKSGNSPEVIIEVLEQMGHEKAKINLAFDHAGHSLRTRHQDIVAENDFLPPLSKVNKSFQYRAFPETQVPSISGELVEFNVVENNRGELFMAPTIVTMDKMSRRIYRNLIVPLFYFMCMIVGGAMLLYYALKHPNLVDSLMKVI